MADSPKRQIWVACVLSLCCAGLGHLYAGRLTRGLVLFLSSLAVVPAAALVAGLIPSTAALAGLLGAVLVLLGLWLFAVVDACRIAARTPESERHEYQQPWVYALFIAAGICSPLFSVVSIRRDLLEAFYLPTDSMSPTLRNGDRILTNKTTWRLQNLDRSDVIVFRAPDKRHLTFVKRIIGLPGDHVTIDGDAVIVNGKSVELPGDHSDRDASRKPAKTAPSGKPAEDKERETDSSLDQTVPPGTCFVLGDNFGNSHDSRSFGPVPMGDIIGVAEYIYLPGDTWARFGRVR